MVNTLERELYLSNCLQINHEIDYIGYWLNFEIHQAFNSDARPSQVGGIELYHQFDAKRPAYFTSMFL
ncbi:regulatory protein [Staphylococcus gallinarum]|uniref:Regulatory protein n=1 Tax=Staphylococcus gallinarum TaxID=1293 RepID=A0A380FPD7_STAGA|nr:regulatory protein [Staphylococcus gallinarum]